MSVGYKYGKLQRKETKAAGDGERPQRKLGGGERPGSHLGKRPRRAFRLLPDSHLPSENPRRNFNRPPTSSKYPITTKFWPPAGSSLGTSPRRCPNQPKQETPFWFFVPAKQIKFSKIKFVNSTAPLPGLRSLGPHRRVRLSRFFSRDRIQAVLPRLQPGEGGDRLGRVRAAGPTKSADPRPGPGYQVAV